MTTVEKRLMFGRILRIDLQRFIPAICDHCERFVEFCSKIVDYWQKGISEIPVLASAKAVSTHHHTTSKKLLVVRAVQERQVVALVGAEEGPDDRSAIRTKIDCDLVPINRFKMDWPLLRCICFAHVSLKQVPAHDREDFPSA